MKNYTATTSSYYELIQLNASQTIYVLQNLRAGAKYKFQVSAMNKFGSGERSAESSWIETQTLGIQLSFLITFVPV